jgi:hypothetical protein
MWVLIYTNSFFHPFHLDFGPLDRWRIRVNLNWLQSDVLVFLTWHGEFKHVEDMKHMVASETLPDSDQKLQYIAPPDRLVAICSATLGICAII